MWHSQKIAICHQSVLRQSIDWLLIKWYEAWNRLVKYWGISKLSQLLRATWTFHIFSLCLVNMYRYHLSSIVYSWLSICLRTWFMGSNPLRAWNFFRYYFNYWFSSVYSCEDLLYSFLHRSAHTWFSYIYKLKIPFFKRQLICNLLFFCALQKSASSFNLCCWSSRMPRCRFGTKSNELNFTDIEKDYEKIEQQVL